MKQELIELEKIILEKKYKSYATFQVGINGAFIIETLRKSNLKFEFPKDLFDLYQWHNGQEIYKAETSTIEFIYFSLFYPLEEAIAIYNRQKEYFGEENFPLFGCVDTEHLLIDLSKDSKDYLTIKSYDPYEEYPIKIYPSLESMIQSNLDCYSLGAYYPDENGVLCRNSDLYIHIHKKYGKGCEYWDSVS